ncbi:MAG: sulfatase-like hydrolase/transferase [Bryobacteraceae bacterium]
MVAAVLFAVAWLCRKYLPLPAYRVARFGSFALALIPLNGLRACLSSLSPYLKSPLLLLIGPRTVILLIPLFIVMVWFAWRWQRLVVRLAVAGLLSLLPFCAFTFGQATWRVVHYHGQPFLEPALAPRLARARTAPRVVWVIFDEWDYRLTFVDRPAKLSMPAVDRLLAESVSATHAHAPSMDTGTSLPSLITGRRLRMVVASQPTGMPRFSAEQVEGLDRMPWSHTPTVFSAARQSGFNTALIGWYLPYCRMFYNVLTDCAWWPMPIQANSTGDTFLQKVLGQTVSLVQTDSFSPVGQSSAVRYKARICQEFLERSKTAVSDPAVGLIFLHVPVPHGPHPYNRLTGRFDLKNKPLTGYVDSLALMDQMLSELRREIEKSGTWWETALVLSADHPDRTSVAIDGKFDSRVPFLLKLPGETKAATFDTPFTTAITSSLVLSVLNGTVASVPDALAWLERHHRDAEAPVPATD